MISFQKKLIKKRKIQKIKKIKKTMVLNTANNLKTKGAGFGTDTNVVTIITADEICELEIMSKDEVAEKLVDSILEKRNKIYIK